jgi:hypothetical protein
MKRNADIAKWKYRFLKAQLQASVRNLFQALLKPRTNAAVEPLPVQFGLETQILHRIEALTGTKIKELENKIRGAAISSLINYKDCCVFPQQCRFFFLQVTDEPYYARSWNQHGKPLIPRQLYVLKSCMLKAKGFRRTRQECPFKSVKELQLFEKIRIRKKIP